MAQQIHVAVLALQTTSCCASAAGDEIAVAGGVVKFGGVGAYTFCLLALHLEEGGGCEKGRIWDRMGTIMGITLDTGHQGNKARYE